MALKLFSQDVQISSCTSGNLVWALDSEISSLSQKASTKRKIEYVMGRHCARTALNKLGVIGFAVLSHPDGRPRWPSGVTGSISHTHNYAVAAVSEQKSTLSLGIDCEHAQSVWLSLQPQFCSETEMDIVRDSRLADCHRAALLFSAKEALFKCWFQATFEYLGHAESVIHSSEGKLVAHIDKAVTGNHLAYSIVRGNYLIEGPIILTGFSIPAPCSDDPNYVSCGRT